MRPSLLFAAVLLLLSGCTHIYVMEAESSMQPPAGGIRSYTIRHIHSQDPQDTLRYQEAEKLLKSALAARGLYEAPKPELADVQIEFDYGMTDPRVHSRHVKDPIYNPAATRMKEMVIGTDKEGRPIKAYVPVYDQPEIIGYRERLEREIVVEKHVRLVARDNKAKTEESLPPVVWNVYVRNTDDSSDLRRYLQVMIAICVDYVGKDSNGINTFQVSLENGIPVYISGGYDQAREVALPAAESPSVAASEPAKPGAGNEAKPAP